VAARQRAVHVACPPTHSDRHQAGFLSPVASVPCVGGFLHKLPQISRASGPNPVGWVTQISLATGTIGDWKGRACGVGRAHLAKCRDAVCPSVEDPCKFEHGFRCGASPGIAPANHEVAFLGLTGMLSFEARHAVLGFLRSP
jgi:hypothetical protein